MNKVIVCAPDIMGKKTVLVNEIIVCSLAMGEAAHHAKSCWMGMEEILP